MHIPFFHPPKWAIALETKIMAAIDDLTAAVATLTANFTNADTAIQAEITALTAALASNNTAAISAAAANISAISAKMAADTTALTASLPAAGGPAPSIPTP